MFGKAKHSSPSYVSSLFLLNLMEVIQSTFRLKFVTSFLIQTLKAKTITLMYDILLQHFNKHIQLADEEFTECTSRFKYKKYRKHQYILQNGDVSRYETFTLKGCTRTYELDDKGVEHIVQFGLETW